MRSFLLLNIGFQSHVNVFGNIAIPYKRIFQDIFVVGVCSLNCSNKRCIGIIFLIRIIRILIQIVNVDVGLVGSNHRAAGVFDILAILVRGLANFLHSRVVLKPHSLQNRSSDEENDSQKNEENDVESRLVIHSLSYPFFYLSVETLSMTSPIS